MNQKRASGEGDNNYMAHEIGKVPRKLFQPLCYIACCKQMSFVLRKIMKATTNIVVIMWGKVMRD